MSSRYRKPVAYTSVELKNIDAAHDTLSNDEQHAGQEMKIRSPRKLLSAAALRVVALDIGTSLLSLYFIIFATLVYQQDGKPATAKESQRLLEAAKAVSSTCPG
jgi:hypothetical protein